MYVSVNWVGIDSDNGLAPNRCQAIIWTNTGLLSIGPLGTNFSEILIKIQMHLKILSVKWQPFCPGGDKLSYRHGVGEGTGAKKNLGRYSCNNHAIVNEDEIEGYIIGANWASVPGPQFNKKMLSYQYRKSIHNGISYTGKMTSLYWISPLEMRRS